MVEVVKLSGFRELEAALAELPKATGRAVLRKIARAALEPMATDASNKAPHRTGKLAFSISISEKRTRRAVKFIGASSGKKFFRSDASTGIDMAMGPAAGFGAVLSYAYFDEFGTVDTPAFGFMRGAWDAGATRSLDYIKDNLWAEIEKSTKRLAARRAKAA